MGNGIGRLYQESQQPADAAISESYVALFQVGYLCRHTPSAYECTSLPAF